MKCLSLSLGICQAWQAMFNDPLLTAMMAVTCLKNNSEKQHFKPIVFRRYAMSVVPVSPLSDSLIVRDISHVNCV